MARLCLAPVLLLAIVSCDDAVLPPEPVDIEARPGTAVVIPINAPIRGEPAEALGYIPAFPRLEPKPLPQGAKLLAHTVGLIGTGRVIGDLLIEIPPTAQGDISFTVSADGTGSAVSGRSVFFASQTTPVSVTVKGEAPAVEPPQLTGDWRAGDSIWTFYPGTTSLLEIKSAGEEKKSVRFVTLPDGDGRWFLVNISADGNTYWIDINDDADTILIDHPNERFDPYLTLTRQ